jgi:hypothetical protein
MKASPLLVLVALVALLAGCGSSNKSSAPPPPSTGSASGTTTQPAPGTSTSGAGALRAEATAAATGDIPDNQVFLRFRDVGGGWSMKYPEGWLQSGSSANVSFRDKNNIVRVVIAQGKQPTAASIRSELAALNGSHVEKGPQKLTLAGAAAFKVVYTTVSAPNQVTGKRVTLIVDRYYLAHGAKEAIVDLGTPRGVDNIDAYRLMIESFRWK